MLSTVLATAREHQLFARGESVLIAVSGGPDSMSLMHVMHELAPRLGVSLRAACVDHGLRPEAADEAQWVCAQAQLIGIPCETVRVDVAAARRREPGSLQAAARTARLEALASLAGARGCDKVALGHQADDQAETVLFRVLRGTGVAGLAGIPYARAPFVRPLLDVARAEIVDYLSRRGIPYRTDPSNHNLRFARARVRHELLPMARQLNPRVVDALRALAREVAGAPLARLRREAAEHGLALGARAAETIARLAGRAQGSSIVDLEGGWAEVTYGRVSFHAGSRPEARFPEVSVRVTGPGIYQAAGLLPLSLGEGAPPEAAALFDADALAWPLILRPARAGDRMRPRGGAGSRKLSDLMIDARLPRFVRATLPVLVGGDGEILYVHGLRPAERGRPGAATGRLVWVRSGPCFAGEGARGV